MPPRPMVNKSFTFAVKVDWNNDGTFTSVLSTAFGVGDDISRFVKQVDITQGNSDPQSNVADIGKATIILDNKSKWFSPANTVSPFYGYLTPHKAVYVAVTDGVNIWQRFAGFIESITPTSGSRKERECTIECCDYLGVLQGHMLSLPVITGQTGDVLAKTIVNTAILPRYYSQLIYKTATPADGNYVTINGVTFTFRNTISSANDVLIDTTFRAREATFDNLRRAINGEGGAGTLYHINTVRPNYIVASMHRSHYQTCQDDSPVRYYRMNEAAGTTMYDHGTNGTAGNGTYSGSPTLGATSLFSVGDADKAVTFDGTNDYASIPSIELYGRSWSLELWVKFAGSPPAQQDVFSIHSAFSANQAFYMRYETGVLTAYFYSGSSVNSGALATGTGYLVTVTYDAIATTLKMYINGTLTSTATSAGPYSGLTPTIQLGVYSAAAANYTKADIDDVKLYFSALSAEAVQAHYDDATSGFGVLIAATVPGALGTITSSASGLSISNILVTSLEALSGVVTYETGVETFDYAGDSWGEERTNALSAITEVTTSEQGWFYQDVDGLIYWRNRNYPFTRYSASVVGAFNLDALPEGSTQIERIKNRVVVSYTPRSTVTSGVVAQAKNAISVPGTVAGSGSEKHYGSLVVASNRDIVKNGENTKTVDFEFRDAVTGQKMAITSLVLPPTPVTDWQAGEQTAGDNNGYYNNFNYLNMLVQNLGTKARVTITNTATGTLRIFDFQLRGEGLAKYEQTQIIREDQDSIDLYSRRVMTVNLPLPVQQTYAEALSEYLLSRFSTPAFEITKIGFGNRQRVDNTNIYAIKLGDVITVTDEQFGVTALKHQVVGINSTLHVDPSNNNMEFTLKRIDDQTYSLWDDPVYAKWDETRWTI